MPLICCVQECAENFPNLKLLRFHLNQRHSCCNVFKCNNNCTRLFSSWNSFTKHIRTNHDNLLNTTTNEVQNASGGEATASENSLHLETHSAAENDLSDISPQDFYSTLIEQSDVFVAKLLCKSGLPRSHVDYILNDFSTFLGGSFLTILQDKVMNALEQSKADEHTQEELKSMFESLSKPFDHLSNDYKRLQYFRSKGDYIPRETCVIDDRSEVVNSHGCKRLRMKPVTVQLIPLRKVLKRFFELPDAYEATLKYVEFLESESGAVSNFIQCEKLKSIKRRFYTHQDTVLPLWIFYDDFQPNNELGPHDEKIGVVYASVPCLPKECQSKVENIFAALFFNSEDRKIHGNRKVFKPLIEELKYVQSHGVTINLTGSPEIRIYFAVSWLLRDNLGLNGMNGNVESFRSNFPCRLCKVPKELLSSLCEEDESLLRTLENYQQDLAVNNVSTGIKEEMVFSEIPTMDIFSISCDAFHDGAEGICRYTMGEIIHHFHSNNSRFLDALHSRIACFDHGPDADNIFLYISLDAVLKKHLKSTGAEMINFVRLFGLYILDLVDLSDPFWELYLLLNEIMSILQSKKLPYDLPSFLRVLVKDFNKLYMNLTSENLKPKFHFLVHYPNLFKVAGPFAHYATIRYEARHRPIKQYCKVSMSRVNLIYSVAVKQQLSLCHRFTVNESILPKVGFGSVSIVNLREILYFEQFEMSLPVKVKDSCERSVCYSWIEHKGNKYRVGVCVVVGVEETRELKFGKILYLLLVNGKPLFICSNVTSIGLNESIRAIQIDPSCTARWFCVWADDVLDPCPLHIFFSSQ